MLVKLSTWDLHCVCAFYLENMMQSKLQIYSSELVVSRFVLWESRAEVLWNRDSSRNLRYSVTFNYVATTDCHTIRHTVNIFFNVKIIWTLKNKTKEFQKFF